MPGHGWFGGSRNSAYHAVAAGALALTLLSATIVLQGRFRHVGHSRFIYLQLHPLWRMMMWLALLKGLAQGYIVTIPAMLILMLVGQEGLLGSLVSVGGIFSAFAMYGIGRLSLPRHRLAVFAAGLLVFLAGGVVDSLWYNAAGALLLSLCLLISKPLLDVAYFPIQLQVTNALAARESRGDFSYLFSHECAEYVGRLIGCGLFLALALWISPTFALRYALLAIGIVQLLSFAVARDLLGRLREFGHATSCIAKERVPAPE
jgi:YQGE family putative transporter